MCVDIISAQSMIPSMQLMMCKKKEKKLSSYPHVWRDVRCLSSCVQIGSSPSVTLK